jgi:hypothetical protein
MLDAYQAFYYGQKISTNRYLDFDEGSGEITATLRVNSYSLTDLCTEISRAMNEVSADDDYSVSVDRSTGIITISKAAGTFSILGATGTNLAFSCLDVAGFAQADTSFASSHSGTQRSGFVWEPQFKGQDFVDFEDQQSAVDGTVKKSASGKVESVKYGTQKIMDINFMFNTNIIQKDNTVIRTDLDGVANCRAFMEYATTKADMEFIPDKTNPEVFYKVMLESTPESQDGLNFKLKEQYSKGLAGYFDTGILKFRLIN